jgi:hypothetical protein
MALYNDLAKEIEGGRLSQRWTVADLINNQFLQDKYKKSTLSTTPPNQSKSLPGLGLGDGVSVNTRNPTYYRVGRDNKGSLLFALQQHVDTDINKLESNPALTICSASPDETGVEAIVEDDAPLIFELLPTKMEPSANEMLALLVKNIHEEESWDNRLHNYVWKQRSFFQTQDELDDLIWKGSLLSRLILSKQEWTPQDKIKAVNWAEAIFQWGGTRQQQPITASKIQSTLTNALLNRVVNANAPMNSGYTKVASFGTAFLEGSSEGCPQVINDSRVAASLTTRLDKILAGYEQKNPSAIFPGLGTVDAARGGTRPRQLQLDWPNAYRSWHGQFAATQVVLKIRDILNKNDNYPKMPNTQGKHIDWTIRGVEAVLFMDGY